MQAMISDLPLIKQSNDESKFICGSMIKYLDE